MSSRRQRDGSRASSSSEVVDETSSFRWGFPAERPNSVSCRQGLKFYSDFEWNGVQYKKNDCVFIVNDEIEETGDTSQLYVARLEELCDLGEDCKLGYRYQGWVQWYSRPSEARSQKIEMPPDTLEDCEVLLSNAKSNCKKIDLETIHSKCSVIHVPDGLRAYKYADKFDSQGNPQLYCRFQIMNARRLKSVMSPMSTPRKSTRADVKSATSARKATSGADSKMDVDQTDALPQQFKEIIKQEAVVCMSPKKVSPIKLMRVKSKENHFTPEKRPHAVTPRRDTVEKLRISMSSLGVRTPRTALKELAENKPDSTPRTPKTTNGKSTDLTTTTRSGRKVRRAMFFDDGEFPVGGGSMLKKTNEICDEDLISEDSYVESGDGTSEESEDSESSSEDDEVIVGRRSKRPQRKAIKSTPSKKKARSQSVGERRATSTKTSNGMRAASKRTPGMPSRRILNKGSHNDDFDLALEKLHVCAVPDQLSCRETQFAEIYDFVEGRLLDGVGGCMYISGVPGTGKTATVREVMAALNDAQKEGEVSKFKYIEINGMKLTEPHQAYVQILKQLTGKKATPETAAELLTAMFKGKKSAGDMIVLLADELDLLWTRKQQVLYNLFDWPTHPSSRLIVVAIANTMDLPERMVMNKVASRMGLCRMTFQPYTFQELQEIVRTRLAGLELVDPDAVQFVSRKVAALSGDARRALDVCRRAVELSGKNGDAGQGAKNGNAGVPASPTKKAKKFPVTMLHVNRAIQEMFSSAKVVAISSLSLHEQLLLRAIVEEFRRTGLEETVFYKMHAQYETLARLDGLAPVHCSLLSSMLARLASFRLLTLGDSRQDFHQKICMNVTQDDVRFALKQQKKDDSGNDD